MTTLDKYHTFGRRFIAILIDSLIFIPFSLIHLPFSNRYNFIYFGLIYILFWSLYTILLHYKYGQTIGKAMMDIKVLNLNEKDPLSLKNSFLRESIWLLGQLLIVAIYFFKAAKTLSFNVEIVDEYKYWTSTFSFTWALIEVLTMFLNSKRRSIQDIIARSIVIKVN